MDINKAIQSAFEHHQAGNLQQAEHICREILKVQPDNTDALHFLGLLTYHRGDYDLAINYIEKALQIDPNNHEGYYNLGNAFQEKGQLEEAINSYKMALILNPNYEDAYNNLGLILHEKRELDEAIRNYEKALQLNPNLAYTYNNLGLAFQEKGQFEDAINSYQKALSLNPAYDDAYYNLGNVYQAKGEFDEAIRCYRKALQLNPNIVDAYYNLGNALMELGMLDEAIEIYRRMLSIEPNCAEPYLHIGNILDFQGKDDEATTFYNKALDCEPNFFIARYARCISQLPVIYPDQSSILDSRKRYYDELIRLRDTLSLETPQDIKAAARAVGSQQPFLLACQGFNDRELQQLYGDIVCKIMALRYPQFAERPSIPPILSGEPLRVGVVSGFFHHHSNWKIPIKGWIENLDKQRFKLYGYYTGKKKDKETVAAKQCFKRFIEDVDSFEKLCHIIRSDNLHILIYPEIGMDPMTGRLATLRLAPLQCTSWGHPDTSGLPTIDYYLSSELMEPPNAVDHYTEQLIRLPNLSIYYSPLDDSTAEASRDTFCLRPKSILYLCCHALFTHLPQYDEVYPIIAQHVGDCQFLFIASQMSSFVTEKFRLRLHKAFTQFRLNSEDYVVFIPRLDTGRYHAINRLSDILLDSIGWSGCNSTFEAIACNLPIVTLPGEMMRGRHSTAILTMMELTETIAATVDDYVELAVRLGQDSKWRHQISEKIAINKHLVYNDRTCITALEDFLEQAIKERLRVVGS